jgi:hypothetical protein
MTANAVRNFSPVFLGCIAMKGAAANNGESARVWQENLRPCATIISTTPSPTLQPGNARHWAFDLSAVALAQEDVRRSREHSFLTCRLTSWVSRLPSFALRASAFAKATAEKSKGTHRIAMRGAKYSAHTLTAWPPTIIGCSGEFRISPNSAGPCYSGMFAESHDAWPERRSDR